MSEQTIAPKADSVQLPPLTPHQEVSLIFWDMGDVLISLDFQTLFGAICPLLHTTPKAFHQALFRSGIFDRVNRGSTTPREFHREVMEALEQDVTFEDFRDAWVQFFQPRPGMADVLQQLRDKVPQWLLSNTDPMHHDACKARFAYLEQLTGQLTSYGLEAMKPEASIYQRALARVQQEAAPERVLFFDDKPENIEGARAVGIHAYLYTTEDECRRMLRQYGLL